MNGRPPLTEDLLSAFLDDELDAATQAVVEARVAESTAWRAVLAEVRQARDALRALPVHEAPAGFWQRAFDAVTREPVGDDALAPIVQLEDRRLLRTPRSRWTAVAGAAAAVIIGAVAFVPSQDRARPPVASFADAHSARSSVSDDAVTQLAGFGQTPGLR